ncbi:hypothetical protein FMEXI_9172 [Fusarium mexicanum]|uniref:RING-type domain-containing protein n=1 Tax=Fusarium mexicanum TaxID=751941 RepID=A0A8H5ILE0_9HYPO|nr:hypothetical protein FMEXI_9172 [Fusarium mexicanum]
MSSPKDPITAAYYPELAKIINNDPTAIDRLEIECGMCRDKMSNLEDKTCSAIILPCGHMFCPPCVQEFRQYNISNDVPSRCPVCRFDLISRTCGCPGDRDTLFDPTQHQDEDLLARLQEQISRRKGACVLCQMTTLARGLRCITLYLYDPVPIIKGGLMLRVTVEKRDEKEIRVETDKTEVVKQLPISPELMELFTIASESLDTAWYGPRAPGEESCPFNFELALCKRFPEDHEYWPHRIGQLQRFRFKWWQYDNLGRLAHALEDAVKLAGAFTSDVAYKNYKEKVRAKERQEFMYFVSWDAVRRIDPDEDIEDDQNDTDDKNTQDNENGRLYASAAIQVVGGVLDNVHRFRAFLARHIC